MVPFTGSVPAVQQKKVSFVMTSSYVDDPAGEKKGDIVMILILLL